MQFASVEMEAPAFYPLCTLATQQHWTINAFYISHLDGDLLSASVASQMEAMRPDTLYIFTGLDELRGPMHSLHYYRLDDILVGTVDPLPLPLPEEELHYPLTVEIAPAKTISAEADSIAAATENGSVVLTAGGMAGPAQDLWPGYYEVTAHGSGFDYSHVFCGWSTRSAAFNKIDIQWLENNSETIVFRFYVQELAFNWNVFFHMMSDAPITVDKLTVTRLG